MGFLPYLDQKSFADMHAFVRAGMRSTLLTKVRTRPVSTKGRTDFEVWNRLGVSDISSKKIWCENPPYVGTMSIAWT